MSKDEYRQLIKKYYLEEETNYEKLFDVVKSIAEKIGLDNALELLGKREEERRKIWADRNLAKFKRSENILDDVIKIFYEACVGIKIGNDGEIVEKSDKRLVTRWWNYCPILEACKANGLDTREVCRKAYNLPNQTFLSMLDPRLKFDRNYKTGIRPHASYCEEIITVEE